MAMWAGFIGDQQEYGFREVEAAGEDEATAALRLQFLADGVSVAMLDDSLIVLPHVSNDRSGEAGE